MEFEFKITTWECVTVDEEQEEKVLQAIKEGKVNSASDIFNLVDDAYCEQLTETEEQMSVEENGGFATIEVREDGDVVWGNGAIVD